MRRRAVVGGAALAAGAVAGHRAANEQTQEPAAEEQPASDEQLATIAKLGELHQSGVLTDEEFAQKKAEVLGS
jgi:membrane protease subunit (stomatin/prohibitin family)